MGSNEIPFWGQHLSHRVILVEVQKLPLVVAQGILPSFFRPNILYQLFVDKKPPPTLISRRQGPVRVQSKMPVSMLIVK